MLVAPVKLTSRVYMVVASLSRQMPAPRGPRADPPARMVYLLNLRCRADTVGLVPRLARPFRRPPGRAATPPSPRSAPGATLRPMSPAQSRGRCPGTDAAPRTPLLAVTAARR